MLGKICEIVELAIEVKEKCRDFLIDIRFIDVEGFEVVVYRMLKGGQCVRVSYRDPRSFEIAKKILSEMLEEVCQSD